MTAASALAIAGIVFAAAAAGLWFLRKVGKVPRSR
jgi:hypothetical protein